MNQDDKQHLNHPFLTFLHDQPGRGPATEMTFTEPRDRTAVIAQGRLLSEIWFNVVSWMMRRMCVCVLVWYLGDGIVCDDGVRRQAAHHVEEDGVPVLDESCMGVDAEIVPFAVPELAGQVPGRVGPIRDACVPLHEADLFREVNEPARQMTSSCSPNPCFPSLVNSIDAGPIDFAGDLIDETNGDKVRPVRTTEQVVDGFGTVVIAIGRYRDEDRRDGRRPGGLHPGCNPLQVIWDAFLNERERLIQAIMALEGPYCR